eukprot:1146407-Pelagomonas_calceolata.AAC.1
MKTAAWENGTSSLYRAQPPSWYGALIKRGEGESKEEVPGSNPCGQGAEKDALYWWESTGDSYLNARGRTANCNLSCSNNQAFCRIKLSRRVETLHFAALIGNI